LLAGDWVRGKLSVREAEARMEAARGGPSAKKAAAKKGKAGSDKILRDANTDDLERRLTASLGVKVRILHQKGSQAGVFQVFYQTLDQLDEIIDRLGDTHQPGVKPMDTPHTAHQRKVRGLD
jgi:hypothetical protein